MHNVDIKHMTTEFIIIIIKISILVIYTIISFCIWLGHLLKVFKYIFTWLLLWTNGSAACGDEEGQTMG